MDELVKLAAKVEAADGPDRELDARIWCAVNGKKYIGWFEPYGQEGRATAVEYCEPPKRTRLVTGSLKGPREHSPLYTASVDAALTLLPEGWFTYLAMEDRHSHVWTWKLRGGFGNEHTGIASTPALALLAAICRAKAGA